MGIYLCRWAHFSFKFQHWIKGTDMFIMTHSHQRERKKKKKRMQACVGREQGVDRYDHLWALPVRHLESASWWTNKKENPNLPSFLGGAGTPVEHLLKGGLETKVINLAWAVLQFWWQPHSYHYYVPTNWTFTSKLQPWVGTDTAYNLSKIQHRLVRRFFLKVASKMVVFHLWMQVQPTRTHSNLQLGEM
jgi:hypothetical protein